MKIQETIYELRQQPIVTTVTIVGTALAIFLIMVVVITNQVAVAPFSPESNRDRWLVNRAFSIRRTGTENGESNSAMSYKTAKEIYGRLKIPERVTIYGWSSTNLCESPDGKIINVESKGVDAEFWKVMDFTFIDGVPFDQAQFEAGETLAVITESVARRLFNTSKAAGKKFTIDYVDYKVCGVVEDVSPIADTAYSEIWIPFTSTDLISDTWMNDIMGCFSAIILAKDASDFPKIRAEFEESHRKFFEKFDGAYEYIQRERPFDQETAVHTFYANVGPDMDSVHRQNFIIFAILLIVPAINLSSMTHSRMVRQEEIIGVKRAFGATRGYILKNLFIENLIITIVAGCLGIILSVIFAYIASEALFTKGYSDHNVAPNFNVFMIMQWKTFGLALLFCFILNLASAGLPSIMAARTNIVNALSKR